MTLLITGATDTISARNAVVWAPPIASFGVTESAAAQGTIPFIQSGDVAEVGDAALTEPGPGYHGRSLSITGPVALSTADMVTAIGAAVGKPFGVEHFSSNDERRRWVLRGETPESVDCHPSIFTAIRTGRLSATTDTVACVLGHRATTFDQWAIENADAIQTSRAANDTAVPVE